MYRSLPLQLTAQRNIPPECQPLHTEAGDGACVRPYLIFHSLWGTTSPSNVVVKPFNHPNPSYNPSLLLYLPTNSVLPLIPKIIMTTIIESRTCTHTPGQETCRSQKPQSNQVGGNPCGDLIAHAPSYPLFRHQIVCIQSFWCPLRRSILLWIYWRGLRSSKLTRKGSAGNMNQADSVYWCSSGMNLFLGFFFEIWLTGTQQDFLFIYLFFLVGVGMCLTGTAEESAGRGE